MNFGNKIVVVLNKIVVPKYTPIDCVVYKEYGNVGKRRFYEIIYMTKKGRFIKRDMMVRVTHETHGIVRMVGIQSHEDYAVYFSRGRRNKILSYGV